MQRESLQMGALAQRFGHLAAQPVVLQLERAQPHAARERLGDFPRQLQPRQPDVPQPEAVEGAARGGGRRGAHRRGDEQPLPQLDALEADEPRQRELRQRARRRLQHARERLHRRRRHPVFGRVGAGEPRDDALGDPLDGLQGERTLVDADARVGGADGLAPLVERCEQLPHLVHPLHVQLYLHVELRAVVARERAEQQDVAEAAVRLGVKGGREAVLAVDGHELVQLLLVARPHQRVVHQPAQALRQRRELGAHDRAARHVVQAQKVAAVLAVGLLEAPAEALARRELDRAPRPRLRRRLLAQPLQGAAGPHGGLGALRQREQRARQLRVAQVGRLARAAAVGLGVGLGREPLAAAADRLQRLHLALALGEVLVCALVRVGRAHELRRGALQDDVAAGGVALTQAGELVEHAPLLVLEWLARLLVPPPHIAVAARRRAGVKALIQRSEAAREPLGGLREPRDGVAHGLDVRERERGGHVTPMRELGQQRLRVVQRLLELVQQLARVLRRRLFGRLGGRRRPLGRATGEQVADAAAAAIRGAATLARRAAAAGRLVDAAQLAAAERRLPVLLAGGRALTDQRLGVACGLRADEPVVGLSLLHGRLVPNLEVLQSVELALYGVQPSAQLVVLLLQLFILLRKEFASVGHAAIAEAERFGDRLSRRATGGWHDVRCGWPDRRSEQPSKAP